ncbi:hypothetical protein E2P81_ATG05607 [Venturia nashicola]|nr:hypothetical protein E2P81_ATG05607 [Venturia nashicola]
MNDTVDEDWPEWDDTFAEHDARVLFPDLYTGSNATRNTGDRNNPVIGIPGTGGIPWSEGNKIIDDAFPDYTPPEPYDFEKEFAEWDQKTLREAHFGGVYDATVTEADRLAGKSANPVSNVKSPDRLPPARKDSIGMFNSSGHKKLAPGHHLLISFQASNSQPSGFPPTPGRYPSLSSTGRSQFDPSTQSSTDEEGPVTKNKKFNSKNKNTNRKVKKKAGAGLVELAATSSVSSNEYDEFGSYPPTPGAPSDMDVEKDGDMTMDEAEPVQASAGALSIPKGQDEMFGINPDVQMSDEVHVELDATLGAERTKRSDIHAKGSDPGEPVEYVAEDVVMGENSVGATENIESDLAEYDKQTRPGDGEDAESRHPLPPLFYATPRLASRNSPIVEIPAPSVILSAAPTVEVGTSSVKPTQNDLTNKSETINKTGKSSQHASGRNSPTQHNRFHVQAPTTPPGKEKQKQKQVSEASFPTATPSPLKLLQQSVKMGRKSSFSEAQASSEDTFKVKAKSKGRASGKAGIISQDDEDLIDDFVFMSEKEVTAMKTNDLRNHIRAIESLRRWHNGVHKKGMTGQYMIWQRSMQALKDSKAESATKAVAQAAEPSQVGGSEEEGSDRDAEGSTDQEFFEAQESPVSGIVTPGQPLKSPFTDQPRSDGKSPFVAKLNAAKLINESPVRKAGRSRTPQDEPEFYQKFEEEKEQEEMDKKRKRRSISRPASYKV